MAKADRILIEMLEAETMDLLDGCGHVVNQLLVLLRRVKAVAQVSAASQNSRGSQGGGAEFWKLDGIGEHANRTPMLVDDRIRSVRRNKELMASQHDMLCQIMLQKSEGERLL